MLPRWPDPGQEVSLGAIVKNQSGTIATQVLAQFWVDTAEGGWLAVGAPARLDTLAVGASASVSAGATVTATRPIYIVKVEVSSARADAFDGDNAATTTFALTTTPVAKVGAPATATVGQAVTLDGGDSRNAAQYEWRLKSKPAGSLADIGESGGTLAAARFEPLGWRPPFWAKMAAATASLHPDVAGAYVVELVVVDAAGNRSAPDELTIHAQASVANRPPVPPNYALRTARDRPGVIAVAKLLGATTDPDGDAVSLTAVSSPSAQNGTVSLSDAAVTYTPPAGYSGADSFTYTVTDARGATAQGTVTVTVTAPAGNGPNILGVTAGATTVTLRLAGIPNQVYQIEASTDLLHWTRIGQATAGPHGLFEFSDSEISSYPSRYYRAAL